MPYILQEKRPQLDEVVKQLHQAEIKADGDLNYVLFAYCKRYVVPSYNNYKNFIGELLECAAEIRGRLLTPYKDKKIQENGDVE